MEENANKLHLCTDFNSCTRVTVYAKCIYVSTEYLKYYGKHTKTWLFSFHCAVCRCLAACQLILAVILAVILSVILAPIPTAY